MTAASGDRAGTAESGEHAGMDDQGRYGEKQAEKTARTRCGDDENPSRRPSEGGRVTELH